MYKYISPQELETLIKSKSKDYLIVDVRDDDYRGGNIKGGRNIPADQFHLKVHQLIDDTQNVSKIIFHCALSQQRGPKAARIYSEARLLHEGGTDVEYEVYALKGGFSDFQQLFRHDPELVENWDERAWD
ncbi:Rhodanese-like protein [Thelephora terrestris]|uniref:Rhodanese-like protein n=1 Tax=Thelephora terrestris TaxID=56493 RepID=A0A9P6H6P8_9AGAM|nr:Rhodanese-like protein [Thelephora terrestris]